MSGKKCRLCGIVHKSAGDDCYPDVDVVIGLLDDTEDRLDEIRAFLQPEAQCPCCCETDVCLDDCTYREDCVNSPLGLAGHWERLEAVRDVLRRTHIPGRSE